MEEIYSQKKPSPIVSNMIKSFWLIDDKDQSNQHIEKIIPDGYPEIIFHYGDIYKTNINGFWLPQQKNLLAGQIRNYFFLENTGNRRVFGIKLQPWALTALFDVNMFHLTDTVIEIPKKLLQVLEPVRKLSISSLPFNQKVQKIDKWFEVYISQQNLANTQGQKAVEFIIDSKGKLDLKNIRNEVAISERSLERYFRKHIGLSPKYYSRIIRFSYIFQLIQGENIDWADIIFIAGFYDQSHFIKNFKEFTGEDPSQYGFSEENLANFFLRK